MEKALQRKDSTDFSRNLDKITSDTHRKVIIASHTRKLSDVPTKEFAVMFFAQLVFHGIAQPDNVEPIQMMHDFISNNFKWCTEADFKAAFEMNAAGSLREKHNPYKSFDNFYVGNVLKDYYDVRSEAMIKWNAINQQVIPPSMQLEQRNDNGTDYLATMLTDHVAQYKKGDTQSAYLFGSIMFDYLERNAMLPASFNDDSFLQHMRRIGKANVMHDQEIGKTKMMRIRDNERMYERFKEDVLLETKKIIYFEYLKQQQ